LHGKAVRGERVVSTQGHAWAEPSSNSGVHSCTNGAWVLLDGTCTFGPSGKIRRVRSLSAPPALATAFIPRASAPTLPVTHTHTSANPENSASLDLSAGSSAQRRARVQGYRSAPGARTVWRPIW
jgi:hypothetical protein